MMSVARDFTLELNPLFASPKMIVLWVLLDQFLKYSAIAFPPPPPHQPGQMFSSTLSPEFNLFTHSQNISSLFIIDFSAGVIFLTNIKRLTFFLDQAVVEIPKISDSLKVKRPIGAASANTAFTRLNNLQTEATHFT